MTLMMSHWNRHQLRRPVVCVSSKNVSHCYLWWPRGGSGRSERSIWRAILTSTLWWLWTVRCLHLHSFLAWLLRKRAWSEVKSRDTGGDMNPRAHVNGLILYKTNCNQGSQKQRLQYKTRWIAEIDIQNPVVGNPGCRVSFGYDANLRIRL